MAVAQKRRPSNYYAPCRQGQHPTIDYAERSRRLTLTRQEQLDVIKKYEEEYLDAIMEKLAKIDIEEHQLEAWFAKQPTFEKYLETRVYFVN